MSSIGTSPSAYYQRATGELSTRARGDELLLREIRRVYRANYEAYGSLRVWKALQREGIEVGRGRVERLMRSDGLVGAKRRGRAWKTTVADPAGSGRPDLVNRDFTATRPDALWIADFTYLRSWEGVGFFSFVLDVYSRRCVGWQLAGNMRTDLWTRCGWRSAHAVTAPSCSSSITPIAVQGVDSIGRRNAR